VVHYARHGLWEDLQESLRGLLRGRGHGEGAMLAPRDVANMVSLGGETVLGLVCLHNEDGGEDPARGNELGETPLDRQVRGRRQPARMLRCALRGTIA
jgi:hypothetical protein